ncbi:MAG: hypothetical protein RIS76_1067, partial [Verrucomicrobiota bacterium]
EAGEPAGTGIEAARGSGSTTGALTLISLPLRSWRSIYISMKLPLILGFLALVPVVQGQQSGAANFTRLTVAAAPGQASGGAGGAAQGGAQTGGIRFVTRPASRVTPILAGASFFAAGGVPVVQSAASRSTAAEVGGVGGVGVAAATPSVEGTSDAVQSLRKLAAGGDPNARRALAVLEAGSARASAARRR